MAFDEVAKKWLGPLIRKIRHVLGLAKVRLLPRGWLSPIENFKKDGWNRRLLESVPTSPPLEIVVFGGYLGNSVQDWLNRVPESRVNVFEPIPNFAKKLEERFAGQNVVTHAFGVAVKMEERQFSLLGDATFFSSLDRAVVGRNEANTQKVLFRSAPDVALLLPEDIGVMEINIEGGEYELIPLLSETEILNRTKFLFVQFHDVGEGTKASVRSSRALLEKTHEMVWTYELVWELWKKRK